MAKRPVTVNDLLDGQVALDLECRTGSISTGMCPTCRSPGSTSSS
jgi:hypothetical protein